MFEDERLPRETDPETLGRALEVELILKRATWAKTRERRGAWRALSLLFLLVVFLGALFAWFYFAPQLRERTEQTPAAENGR
ncbi:MAG: hypothetical protein H0X40_04890 [Chthoniobacterales bacterium]|nr:hypothetical protein [Chthoniobacterales bacterium]